MISCGERKTETTVSNLADAINYNGDIMTMESDSDQGYVSYSVSLQ